MTYKLRKIITSGQTGVDQSALRAAMTLKIESGGWCPPERECENGKITSYFPLKETPIERGIEGLKIPRSLSLEWNVRDSDATLIILSNNQISHLFTDWTKQCTKLYNKPCLTYLPDQNSPHLEILNWIEKYSVKILNITGPSELSQPGISVLAYSFFLQLFYKATTNIIIKRERAHSY